MRTEEKPEAPMTFDQMIAFIVGRIKKVYANHLDDNGGETKWGISVRAHPELKRRISTLTQDEAKKIYRSAYFTTAQIAKYPAKVRLAVFHGAIHQGVTSNNKIVQRALNRMGFKLAVDSVVGPMTLAPLKNTDPLTFLATFSRQRLELFKKHEDYDWTGAGWDCRRFLICDTPYRLFI
jgi:lysozyme family protein